MLQTEILYLPRNAIVVISVNESHRPSEAYFCSLKEKFVQAFKEANRDDVKVIVKHEGETISVIHTGTGTTNVT